MKKKLSLMLAGIFLASSVAVSAAYPLAYPDHAGKSLPWDAKGAPSGKSPAENLFYVMNDDGNVKGFVVLDKDTDGNYFVLAEDEYGTHEYMKQTGDDVNTLEMTDAEWSFNPACENSVAYWLNDESENGFVKQKGFPSVIYDNIIPFDWQTEAKRLWGDSVPASNEDYEAYQTWLSNNRQNGSVSTAEDPKFKLSFLSGTEFVAYKDKIGSTASRGVDAWAGFMTRSISARVIVQNNKVIVSNNFSHISGSNNVTNTTLAYDGNIGWAKDKYFVRPCFWLDKDFFKNNPISVVDSMDATNVMEELMQYGVADLSEIYDDIDLQLIGFDLDVLPEVQNIVVTGPKAAGSLNEISYDFKGYRNAKEGDSKIELYVSQTADGEFTKINADAGQIIFPDACYAKIAVIPFTSDGVSGKRYYSDVFEIKDALTNTVKNCTITDESGNVNASIEIENSSDSESAITVKFTLYDEHNAIVSRDIKETTLTGGETKNVAASLSGITVSTGCRLVLDVLEPGNRPLYQKCVK